KLRVEGKGYVVRDGDVILFRFNVLLEVVAAPAPRESGTLRSLPHYGASYRIRPQFSQLTISFPALTCDAVAVVTFMWQPVQTPCSMATIAASPLLWKRRSKRASKSSSIFRPARIAPSLILVAGIPKLSIY